jgi:hypothetical protein
MICSNCPVQHWILEPSGGNEMGKAGEEGEPLPGIFVLADQSFPAAVLPGSGGGCLGVIRLECGSILELVNLFLDLTRGCSIPAGTVLLVASLTHLADTGISAYAVDLSNAAAKIGRIFQGGIVFLSGLIVPPGSIEDPVLTKELFDVIAWSKKVAKVVNTVRKIFLSLSCSLIFLKTNSKINKYVV